MTSKELNLNLLSCIPSISEAYASETEWQEGDETGSYVVFANVFVPYILKQVEDNNHVTLLETFEFIEKTLNLNDEYAFGVIRSSVLDYLYFECLPHSKILPFMGPITKDLFLGIESLSR